MKVLFRNVPEGAPFTFSGREYIKVNDLAKTVDAYWIISNWSWVEVSDLYALIDLVKEASNES